MEAAVTIDWPTLISSFLGVLLAYGLIQVRSWWRARREVRQLAKTAMAMDDALNKFRREWERIYGTRPEEPR
jgi:hypothetical protein